VKNAISTRTRDAPANRARGCASLCRFIIASAGFWGNLAACSYGAAMVIPAESFDARGQPFAAMTPKAARPCTRADHGSQAMRIHPEFTSISTSFPKGQASWSGAALPRTADASA